MGVLSDLKTYWQNNATLQAALPVSSVFLDYVPPSVSFPYARLSVIGSLPAYVTGGSHIEDFRFQISIFNTDLDALEATADTVQGQFDQTYPITGALICTRTNRVSTGEVINGTYTYHVMLEYSLTYNTSLE
jgi:hypothetical protein